MPQIIYSPIVGENVVQNVGPLLRFLFLFILFVFLLNMKVQLLTLC